jgi:hypothetical protein
MDPITMMLLSQAIPTALNLGKSAIQGGQAKKLAETERPKYQIPQAILDEVNQSKYLAGMTELPGQNLMEDKIGQNIGKGVAELQDVSSNPANLASNVAKLYNSGNDSMGNIGIQAGQNWLQQQGRLGNSLQNLGQYQDKQYDENFKQPYENNMAASSALREGAFRNLSSAGTNIASAVGGAANMKYAEDNGLAGGGNISPALMQLLRLMSQGNGGTTAEVK